MNAGQLNRKIEIRKVIQTASNRGSFNGHVEELYWSTNAQELPLTASRNLEDNQVALVSATIFRVRFRVDKAVNKSMLLVDLHSGSKYTIQSVIQPADDRQWLEIRATLKQ